MEKQKNEVYNRILEIACRLFEEKGYEETTTREIAQEACISRGHLRYYFGKKEELFYAYFSEKEDRILEGLMDVCREIEDPTQFYLITLNAYTGLACSLSAKADVEMMQSYEIISKYERRLDKLTDVVYGFSQRTGTPFEREKLARSIEIANVIMFKFVFDRLNRNRETLTPKKIWEKAARHGLFAYDVPEQTIDRQIETCQAWLAKAEAE